MSTDWNIECMDCRDVLRFSDANHRSDLMQALIAHAPAIAAFNELACDERIWTLDISTGYGCLDTGWFKTHLGHRLVPVNEYGSYLDECGEEFKCSAGEIHRCHRPKHDGDDHRQRRE